MSLSQTRADKIKAPGRYGDGRGLYLQVTRTGSRSWLFRYELHGRERVMGLGPCADFTLEEARERARLARQLLKDGIDPLAVAHETRAKTAQANARTVTFHKAAEAYCEFHAPKWGHPRHASAIRVRLASYVFPVMGALLVGAIDKTIILKAIQPIWVTKNATAERTLRVVKAVLDYAKANGWRDGDNPAAWAGNLAHALPVLSSNNHHAALPFAEMHSFMSQLVQHQSIAARALEFCILTAARTNEVLGARWTEIDMQAKVWTIPAERMKAKKEHRVPLAPRAMEILKALPREGDIVFIGISKGKPLGARTLNHLLKTLRADATVHGFRSSLRDWAAERTRYQNHVIEMALAHAIGNAVEAAYRRGELLEQRTAQMADWARYCATPPAVNKVTPFRARA